MDSAEFNLETGKRFIERARDTLLSRGAHSLQSNRGLWIALALGLIAGASVAAWRVREKRRQAAAEPDYLQRGSGESDYLQRSSGESPYLRGDESASQPTRGLGADESTSLSRSTDPFGSGRSSSDTLKTAPGTSTRQ